MEGGYWAGQLAGMVLHEGIRSCPICLITWHPGTLMKEEKMGAVFLVVAVLPIVVLLLQNQLGRRGMSQVIVYVYVFNCTP